MLQSQPIPRTQTLRTRGLRSKGFTLVELLIVVAVMGIVTAIVLPQLEPSATSQLEAAGGVLLADLDYARQLAVVNNSNYTIAFDSNGTQYTITHSGTITSLDDLPNSPFRRPADPTDQHIGRFDDVPQAGLRVEFHAITPADADAATEQLEFGPLGELTAGTTSTIWLAAGNRSTRYHLPLEVNATTGLATMGQMTSADPTAAASSSRPTSN